MAPGIRPVNAHLGRIAARFAGRSAVALAAVGLASSLLAPSIALAEPPNPPGPSFDTVVLSDGARVVAGEVIVKLKGDAGRAIQSIEALAFSRGVRPAGPPSWRIVGLEPGADIETSLAALANDPAVEIAEPNYVISLDLDGAVAAEGESSIQVSAPNDPLYGYQWNFEQIGAATAWGGATGAGVIVAVIDTGIAPTTEFIGANILPGFDIVDGDNDPVDGNGHGTHVAGTIAQATNNGVGVAGVAHNAAILPIRILDDGGYGTTSGLAAGIDIARLNGAGVINLSVGTSVNSGLVATAIQAAIAAGIPVVASMGNAGHTSNSLNYPAAIPGVIAVGAVRYDETRSFYSSYGAHNWIAAPGGDMTVDQTGDGSPDGVLQATLGSRCGSLEPIAFCFMQGTSMAAPHVTAVIALMLEVSPGLTVDEVRTVLAKTARDAGAPGWDEEYGHGLLDAVAAISAVGANIPLDPVVLGPFRSYLPVVPNDGALFS